MVSMTQAKNAHIKRFGLHPVVIGLIDQRNLPKEICRAVLHGRPYDEREMMQNRKNVS